MKLVLSYLAEHKIKNKISGLLSRDQHRNNIHDQKKTSKTNKSHKFVLNLPQRLDLRSSNKYVALQSLPIYCTWKNIR